MQRILIFFFLLMSFGLSAQQQTDRALQSKAQQLLTGFKGQVGVYIKNLKTNRVVAINADTIFPTASIVKVPIMTGVFDKIEKGELRYDGEHVYKDSLLYAGVDILGSFKSGEKILLKKLVMLMLTTSDNTASLWLQSLAGTGTQINLIMEKLGLKDTRVNSRTPGRENNRTRYGWGQTTPAEMASLFEQIYRGKVISAKASDQMMRCLGRN